jgi:hypothetical protein
MLQKFIDNTFYLLFLFTLVFGVVFYDTSKILSFVDELCAVSLCILYAYYIFHTPNWSVNKLFLATLSIFFFYLLYSLYIHSNVKTAIISDFIIQIKPYLAFFTVYAFAPKFNDQMKKNIRLLTIIFSIYLLGIGITSLFDDTILEILLHHRSRLATASTIMALLYLFCSDYTTKNKIIFLILLSICLLSSRSKAYGFFTIALFFIFYLNKYFRLEFNLKNISLGVILLTLTIIVAWDKIHLYFIQGGFGDGRETSDLYARMALYYFSTEVYTDYFPFGSGFATYATFTSGQYYSPLYNKYGMDIMHGLTENDPQFIADTYYPALAQFGIVGTILFFLFWILLTQKTFHLFNTNNLKNFIISLLIIVFFLIECTSDATITHNRGLFMMMLLALSLREMNREKESIQKIENS